LHFIKKLVILSDRSAAQEVEGPAFAFAPAFVLALALALALYKKLVILSDRSAAQGVEGPAFVFQLPLIPPSAPPLRLFSVAGIVTLKPHASEWRASAAPQVPDILEIAYPRAPSRRPLEEERKHDRSGR
jgi:hypothetical protein